tara:strand:+ start:1563 stop:2279 length:717 start_codon:yes stop_codon:yes gene_type:complete
MDTVLVVEDDKLIREILKSGLEKDNYIIFEAANGTRSVEIVKNHDVDLILLDLYLPDGNGLDYMKDIRQYTNVPIIILSGKNEKAVKVSGLEQGADDYVHKPFDIDELKARIKANLRRYHEQDNMPEPRNGHYRDIVKFGHWTLDRKQYQVFDEAEKSVDLTVQEFELLNHLICNAGQILKRDELSEILRQENYMPTPRAIDVKITRLRKKLENDAAQREIIKTIRGLGYMFNAALLD